MGIVKIADEEFGGKLIDDHTQYNEKYDHKKGCQESLNNNSNQRKMKQTPTTPTNYAKTSGRKAKGSKASRRYENLTFLLNLVDNEEFGELGISDFVEPSVSAFAELLMEQEKMKIWNDFVNRSEEEQERFLQDRCSLNFHKHCCNEKSLSSGVQAVDSWENLSDLRKCHPSFSAQDCFNRIDSKLQSMLRRRHLPKGNLANLEEEVISFFTEWPTSVLVSKLASSFDRLLLHALCQYLDLQSHSYDDDGMRHTQVENKNDDFVLPEVVLTKYIENPPVQN